MNTIDIIGKKVTDILVWSKMEVGGLDEAAVYIVLDNGKTIGIPWDFESEDLEKQPKKGSESLFADLGDIPEYYINPDGKTIAEVVAANKKRASSFFGRLKKAMGLTNGIPPEYNVFKTTYRENELKYLKDQRITDFLMFEDADSVGFIQLENGYIFTEIMMAPHGTGMAGLNYYESPDDFEKNCGTDYKRLSSI